MKLRNLIMLYELESVREVVIRLTRESDDEIGSDIEYRAILTLDISELREDIAYSFAIIVSIHRAEDTRRP